ncbi:MAG: isocitrate/isopropylmalate family dehydrogenase, partial [Candidatus Aminicenantales bacterium]
MPKYKIAILPGDGVGKDVVEATMIVLAKTGLDAAYLYGDIGWEFWCKEGNPLPDRTLKLLRETDACLFGAITSKPKDDADREIDPSLRGQGLSYFSPI